MMDELTGPGGRREDQRKTHGPVKRLCLRNDRPKAEPAPKQAW